MQRCMGVGMQMWGCRDADRQVCGDTDTQNYRDTEIWGYGDTESGLWEMQGCGDIETQKYAMKKCGGVGLQGCGRCRDVGMWGEDANGKHRQNGEIQVQWTTAVQKLLGMWQRQPPGCLPHHQSAEPTRGPGSIYSSGVKCKTESSTGGMRTHHQSCSKAFLQRGAGSSGTVVI